MHTLKMMSFRPLVWIILRRDPLPSNRWQEAKIPVAPACLCPSFARNHRQTFWHTFFLLQLYSIDAMPCMSSHSCSVHATTKSGNAMPMFEVSKNPKLPFL